MEKEKMALVSYHPFYSGIMKKDPSIYINGIIDNHYYNIHIRVYFYDKRKYITRINVGMIESFDLEITIKNNKYIMIRLLSDEFVYYEALGITSAIMQQHESMLIYWLKSLNNTNGDIQYENKPSNWKNYFQAEERLSFVYDLCGK